MPVSRMSTPTQDRLEVFDRDRDELGAEVAGVRLADAHVRAVGVNLDQRRAAQAARAQDVRIAGAGAGQQDRLDVGDLHDTQLLGWSGNPTWWQNRRSRSL